MQRGEVDGICIPHSILLDHQDWLHDHKVNVLFYSEETAAGSDAPSVFKFVKTEEQARLLRFVFSSTEFGRPYVFPPGVPGDRVVAMRAAFNAALADPDLRQEAAKSKLDMSLTAPEDVIALIEKLYQTPPETLEVVRKLLPGGL
jgi:hypothetical protein